ncbi:DUF3486 family protein [Devosia sp. J2-20]|uniref:DUF3486 family protein n=1 Tax=Devosia sp. J2-20 TaxID=3026161 RepID=UPI00249C1DFC|nr:DUF3486 family protein [Devosia sp. J2-20]WDR00737.1 DUF3486 family protein [Devosia sp. J2-20]
MGDRQTRGRLSSIDLLPEEAELIVAWAAEELADTKRTQIDIYAEFKDKLIDLQGEFELGFEIPSFSSFHRHSVRLSALTRRLQRMKAVASAIVEREDATSADDVTMAATLTIKTLILELAEKGGEAGFSPKDAKAMADALRSLAAAENVSTARRQKVEADLARMADNAETAIETVGKEAGLTKLTIAKIKREFLGVRDKPVDPSP